MNDTKTFQVGYELLTALIVFALIGVSFLSYNIIDIFVQLLKRGNQ